MERYISEEDFKIPEPRTKEEIINSLQAICHEEGYIYSLCLMLLNDQFFDAEKILDINWHERINIQEFTLLIGLLVKKEIKINIFPTQEESDRQIEETYSLLEELHLAYNHPFMAKIKKKIQELGLEKENEFPNITTQDFHGEDSLMAEAIFYGGSGAYDFQYLEFALKKYGKDNIWLTTNKNISIEDITSISSALKKILYEKLSKKVSQVDFRAICIGALKIFCFSKDEILVSKREQIEAFLQCFSLNPGKVNSTFKIFGEYNSFDSHPIIVLSEDFYFLPIQFLLAQSIYESPFYWMAQDIKYNNIAFKNRGDAAEEMSYNFLINIFGMENVHRNVSVYKSKKEQITDIDILAIAGNKAVIIQAKSKKLTQLSKTGNVTQIKEDFREAVQKAYDQGLICREAVINKNNKLVDSKGVELILGEYIDEAYIICVTTDHYPAVINQLYSYLSKKETDPYPLAMNIFDLDVVTYYLKDPFEFLYYLRQRVNLTRYARAGSEMAYLGSHLKQKLFPLEGADGEFLDESYAQLIDANFPASRSDSPRTKAAEQLFANWKNEKFQQLLDQVKDSQVPGFTDAIFYLYDISGDGADKLVSAIERVKKMTIRDGKRHDLSMIFENGKSGITFISFPMFSDSVGTDIYYISVARKYKTKADTWLGIATVLNSNKSIDAIVFSKEPWQEDSELQNLVDKTLKDGIPLQINNKKQSKNSHCYCGSGKKFKRCHGKD